ncbi:Nrap protein [Aspergillus heterothallicus]
MSNYTVKRRRLSPSKDGNLRDNKSKTLELSTGANRSLGTNATKVGNTTSQIGRSAELALATGVYKSSLFKLQLDDLVSESRPNYDKQLAALKDTLHGLKDLIEHLPDRPAKSVLEADKEMRTAHGITVPYPEPRPSKDTRYSVAYARPSNVNVIGSFALRTGLKSPGPYVVDMSVTIPDSILQEKDYSNYRYFHKRAYYLACIAAGIKDKKKANLDIKFDLQDGDCLRPIILVQPVASSRSDTGRLKFQIRILTAINDTLFPVSRTLPMRNNIRNGSKDDSDEQGYSPDYNSSLRSEATVALYHRLLSSAAQGCEFFKDACLLGRIWLKQRGFSSSIQNGGFGGFEWSVLMSLLLEGGGPSGKPILLKSYSSYQLFKATVQFLAAKDLLEPLLLSASGILFPNGAPVIYDGKRGINILYKTTRWSYSFLRREANTTLRMLNESRDDNFERVFIFKIDEPLLRFDRIVTIPLTAQSDAHAAISKQTALYEVLTKALGDRASSIHISSRPTNPWSVESKPHRKQGISNLTVGLLLDSDNSTRVVDHGPSAEEKDAAAAFRSFWGEKAELRRFKDGSIRESLVWSEDPSLSIVHQILIHILKRHFNYGEADIGYIGDEFDAELRKNGDGIISYSSSAFQQIIDGFSALERSFQNLEGVPLTVRHLAPASPLLRYTALHVDPISGAVLPPADVVLQFESSARWPDDLVAIQMTKVAFLVKIGDALTETGEFSSCLVGLENEQSKMLNIAFLDVTHVSGILYRLRIHHDREQTLLERQLKDQSVSPQTKQEVAYALAAYKRQFTQSPRLSQAIRTLCTRFPLLSPTIRLIKYWFSCHLFDAHINEELIELMVVRTFTQPHPWEAPSSVMAGFLRTFHFLSRWDWQQEPMFIDLGGELDQHAMEAIRTRFAAWRSIDPAMNSISMFVGSDIDPDGVTWTQYEKPPKVVAARICTLAKTVTKLVREQGPGLEVSQLFLPALEPYDFIIHLNSKPLQGRSAAPVKFKNLKTLNDPTQADKDTIVKAFVRELQACFSPSILFFSGNEHSDVIGGLWNPQTLKPKGWSLGLAFSTVPEDASLSINRGAILNEISRLGLGLISSIEIQKE